MKTLKIKAGPRSSGKLMGHSQVAMGFDCEIIMIDEYGTEIDLTKSVRNVVVNVPLDDVITAKLEFFVEELDLEGIKVEEAL
jgi:hypothetical protein